MGKDKGAMRVSKMRLALAAALLLAGLLFASERGVAEAQQGGVWIERINSTITGHNITSGQYKYICVQDTGGAELRINNYTVTITAVCKGTRTDARNIIIYLESEEDWDNWVTEWFSLTDEGASMQRAGTIIGFSAFTSANWDFRTLSSSDSPFTGTAVTLGTPPSNSSYDSYVGQNGGFLLRYPSDTLFGSNTAPSTPGEPIVSRSSDYTEATLSWTLHDEVTEYEIGRLSAVVVGAGENSRIEYGDLARYSESPTWYGIDEWTETVEDSVVYQYRIRARGKAPDSWSAWSNYIFSGGKPQAPDLKAPTNVRLARGIDDVGEHVTVEWTPPDSEFDNYTVIRSELWRLEGSTLFVYPIALAPAGEDWIDSGTTAYRDVTIVHGRTYEYKVAAVRADLVGPYSDPARVGPINLSLGNPPAGLSIDVERSRDFLSFREVWLQWNAVQGVSRYEVQAERQHQGTFPVRETHVYTDTEVFITAFSTMRVRVRGYIEDEERCPLEGHKCYTRWSEYIGIFVPGVAVEVPLPDANPTDAEFEAAVLQFMETAFSFTVCDPSVPGPCTRVDDLRIDLVMQFSTLLVSLLLAGMSVAVAMKRGMTALGVGMGCAILVLVFYMGNQLLGIPLAWAAAAQILIAVLGVLAMARQFGVMR